MDSRLSHYPPPDEHYQSAYPAATAPPQSSSPSAIDQLQLSAALSEQANYGGPVDHNSYSGVEATIAELSNRTKIDNDGPNGAGGISDQSPGHQGTAGVNAPPPDGSSPRTNRLRKACDSCSIRKVKCDEQGPPCRACANLDIPCTFDRPSRRRGPPNRHAEAIKRRRLEADEPSGPSSPSSPTHAAQALAALSSVPTTMSAESICSLDVVERMIADFFTYVHPLAPFPHETTFMQAFRRRDDVHNRYFVALIAAMVGALVAAFPKRSRMQLRAAGKEHMFRDHKSLVDHCLRTCTTARGPAYLDRDELNIYDAVTSYFIAQAHASSNRAPQCRRYLAETLTIVRSLELPPTDLQVQQQQGFDSEGKPVSQIDFITQELARRIFWKTFVDVKIMQQLGEKCVELAFSFAPSSRETPLPLERDDVHIFNNSFESQTYGTMSELTGFTRIVNVYQSIMPLSDAESTSSKAKQDPSKQRALIKECLDACKAIPSLPDTPVNPYRQLQDFLNGKANQSQVDEATEQRNQQIAIQKATMDASSIATRFYLVDLFWKTGSLEGENDTALEREMREERNKICKDLLQLIGRSNSLQVEFHLDRFVSHSFPLSLYNPLPIQDTDLFEEFDVRSPQVKKLDHVTEALLQHVPERIGSVNSEDSQLLSKFHTWAGNASKLAAREDAWVPENVERQLMAEWSEVQGAVGHVYRSVGEAMDETS
ncbi:hypothetical protein NA57DRAFT_73740 [Rhizodiscina lignyota]|uniref:Zn(2)-C6 fungal-type domain-containing protein n=1 Tax=Rhizodiscina lignyota TaxID=1504668 RepID=A0A9P4M9N4_9PEZI|nr:hypothetical protein NA57DRAFT_73740 [Rhizodiscina lignyota]